MNRKAYLPILFFLFWSMQTQAEFRSDAIEYQGAKAVILDSKTTYTLTSPKAAYSKSYCKTLIRNEYGNDLGAFFCATDMYSDLDDFEGRLYDKFGRLIQKIRYSDLAHHASDANLASDVKYWSFVPSYPNYPYTIEYEWGIKYRKGILSLGKFIPVSDYDIGVTHSEYKLIVPKDFGIHTKIENGNMEYQKESTKKTDCYLWQVNHLAPFENCPYALPPFQQFPMLFIAPERFIYDETEGKMNTWQEYGQWQSKLLQGKDQLPADFQRELSQKMLAIKDPQARIQALQPYLSDTRYVSIQIGIGGFRPMSAEEVYRNKYGDCKALSNYMMSLLKACDIPSNYTEIGMGEQSTLGTFVHPGYTNHVILQVPIAKDTLWVECTNPDIPLGYVHSGISGRNALVIKDGSAYLARVPSYPDSVQLSVVKAHIIINPEANASSDVSLTNHMQRYEPLIGFSKLDLRNKSDYLMRVSEQIPMEKINNIQSTEHKTASPSIHISYELKFPLQRSGNRLLVPAFPVRENKVQRLSASRTSDICIEKGFRNKDTIEFALPSNCKLESLPESIRLESKFGKYTTQIKVIGNKILCCRDWLMYSGKYPLSDYPDFKAFMERIKEDNLSKVILISR